MEDEDPFQNWKNQYDNLDLFIDAVHIIQKCDKMPSELMAERNEAIAIIKLLLSSSDQLSSWELAESFIKQIENGK